MASREGLLPAAIWGRACFIEELFLNTTLPEIEEVEELVQKIGEKNLVVDKAK